MKKKLAIQVLSVLLVLIVAIGVLCACNNTTTSPQTKTVLEVTCVQGGKTNVITIPDTVTKISHYYTSKGVTTTFTGYNVKDIISKIGKTKKDGSWLNFTEGYKNVEFVCVDDKVGNTNYDNIPILERKFTNIEIESATKYTYIVRDEKVYEGDKVAYNGTSRIFSDNDEIFVNATTGALMTEAEGGVSVHRTNSKYITKLVISGCIEGDCELSLAWKTVNA